MAKKFDFDQYVRETHAAREGQLGLETRQKIKDKLAEAEALENQRGLGAQGALTAVKQAKALRSQADALTKWLNSAEFDVAAMTRNRNEEYKTHDAFAAMQREAVEGNALRKEQVNDLYANSTNFIPHADPQRLKEQISRIISGEFETDTATGNKYNTFQLQGRNDIYQAVMTPNGDIGFIVSEYSDGDNG